MRGLCTQKTLSIAHARYTNAPAMYTLRNTASIHHVPVDPIAHPPAHAQALVAARFLGKTSAEARS